MNPYHAAAYWRFLYEQCGGMNEGSEDPAAGMVAIRQVLKTLYAGDLVDIETPAELVQELPAIMDEALRGSACPFGTYRESLLAFARAIYVLRLDGSRCEAQGFPVGCGFYDPKTLYHNPPVSSILYKGEEMVYSDTEQAHPPGIPSSFGVDLVEVTLKNTGNKPLMIEVHGAPGSAARFDVQIWLPGGRSLAPQAVWRVNSTRTGPGGPSAHLIPAINITGHDRLGLIITRVDAEERLDGDGAYTLVLRPDASRWASSP
jgi:hypothetical protein